MAMALKFYSDINVPNIETKNIKTTDAHANNIHTNVLRGLTTQDISTAYIYESNMVNAYINNLHKYPNQDHIDIFDSLLPQGTINLGASNKPFQAIYGNTAQVKTLTCMDNTGYNNISSGVLFGKDGILYDIDTRLSKLGFKKGFIEVAITVNSEHTTWEGPLYKLGDIYYGRWSSLEFNANPTDFFGSHIQINLLDDQKQMLPLKWAYYSLPLFFGYGSDTAGAVVPKTNIDYIALHTPAATLDTFSIITPAIDDKYHTIGNIGGINKTLFASGLIIAGSNEDHKI